MGPLGWTEMVVIFFVALVVLGPKKLPELGKTLGKGLREFKKHSDDLKANWQEHLRDIETPVKQTYQEARAEVEEVSATIAEEEKPPLLNPAEAPTTTPTVAPTVTPEETKPDAN
jgi:sec-independent protein translocase protein TatA